MDYNCIQQTKYYTAQYGYMLERFDSLTPWTTGGNCNIIMDNQYSRSGKSIRVTTGRPSGYIERSVSWNFRGTNYQFRLWVYLHSNYDVLGTFTMLISSQSNLSKSLERSLAWPVKQGWNLIEADIQDSWFNYNNESWDNTFVKIRLIVGPVEGVESLSMTFDSLWVDAENNPRIVLTFDDGLSTAYQNAFPIMKQYGIKGVSYVNGRFVGSSGYMTNTELAELQSVGWDVANHSYDHMNYNGKTVSQIQKSIQENIDWLNDNGFSKGALHFAIPHGVYTPNVAAAIKKCNLLTARSSFPAQFIPPGWEPIYLPSQVVLNTTSLETVLGWIETALRKGQTLIIMLHGITANATDEYEWATSNFASLCQYISGRYAPIPTISEWYDGLGDK